MKILVGYDGSPSAHSAIDAALHMPWPQGTRVRGLVATGGWPGFPGPLREAHEKGMRAYAREAEQRLQERWPDATIAMSARAPERALIAEAARFGADLVVVGWRGHGTFQRLLVGSVSRQLAQDAKCSVMVVRDSASTRAPRRFLVGYDGSRNSRRALRFLAAMKPQPGSRALIVTAAEPMYTPPLRRLPPQTRGTIVAAIRKSERARIRRATARLAHAARILRSRGWRVQTELSRQAPLFALLDAVKSFRAHVLVVGARGTSGLARLLLGSVAAGALDRSPVPTVVAR